ncbi:MAG: FmdB family zinc ribbon protein [Longimicrobiales bacterium]|nr:FmdB family zinc ribbon protein [Longimicrobiales bacterium]
MPRYDFTCQDCGATYEVRLSMSAYATGEGRECTSCGSARTERAFTAVNVIAGSGGGGGRTAGAGAFGGGCGPSGGACGPTGFT